MTAMFERSDGALLPTPFAQGPWGPDTVNGGAVGALLAWGVEQAGDMEGWHPARLTVDMVKMARLAPIEVSWVVRRQGRRIRLVDVEARQGEAVVALGRAVLVREADAPAGEVWTGAASMPAAPDGLEPFPDPASFWAFAGEEGAPGLDAWADPSTPSRTWARSIDELVEGEPMSGFVRAAMAGDISSPMSNWGTKALAFINVDYTLALTRVPHGDALGLATVDRVADAGVSAVVARLYDRQGVCGTVMATALANEVPMSVPEPDKVSD